MSMSFHVITCSQCDFHASSKATWGQYHYRWKDGTEISLERKLGWCHHCNGIRPIEELSGHRITRELGELDQSLDRLMAPGIWNALRRRFKAVCEEINYLLRKKGELGRYLLLIRNRTSPPRCLTCGDTHVEPLPPIPVREGEIEFYFDDFAEPGPPLPFGFKHPGCGGELLSQPSGIRISIRMQKKVYSPEGLHLQTGDAEYPDFGELFK